MEATTSAAEAMEDAAVQHLRENFPYMKIATVHKLAKQCKEVIEIGVSAE